MDEARQPITPPARQLASAQVLGSAIEPGASPDPQPPTADVSWRTSSVAQTRQRGRELAAILARGDLVILAGPLGAGKTAFTQGIGEGLHVQGKVASPTFVIARFHPPGKSDAAAPALVHVDAYRLTGALEVDDLDLEAEMASAVTVVEWGEGLVEHLTSEYLLISLGRSLGDEPIPRAPVEPADADDEPRRIELYARGGSWVRRLAQLSQS